MNIERDVNLVHLNAIIESSKLPKDILCQIFFNCELSWSDLRTISLVCKSWRSIVMDSAIWERYNSITKKIFDRPIANSVMSSSQAGLIPPLVPLFRSLDKNQLSDDVKALLMTILKDTLLQESFFRVIRLVQEQKRSDSLKFDNLGQFVQEINKRLNIGNSSIQDFLFFTDELFKFKNRCEASLQMIADFQEKDPKANYHFERSLRKPLIVHFEKALDDFIKQDSTQKKSNMLPQLLRLPLEIFYQRQITDQEMKQWGHLYEQSKTFTHLHRASLLSTLNPFCFTASMVLVIHLTSTYWNTKLQIKKKEDGTIGELTIAQGHTLNQDEAWLIEGFLTSNEIYTRLSRWCSSFRFVLDIPETLFWGRDLNNRIYDSPLELRLDGSVIVHHQAKEVPCFNNLMEAIKWLPVAIPNQVPSLITGKLIEVKEETILSAIGGNKKKLQLYKIGLAKLAQAIDL